MQITINGRSVYAKQGETILHVAERIGIKIPTLCYHPDLPPQGVCGACVVEVNGRLMTSCNTRVNEGMEIFTNSERVLKARKINALLLMNTQDELGELPERSALKKIIDDLGMTESGFKKLTKKNVDTSGVIIKNENNCIVCGKCVKACDMQQVNAIDIICKGIYTKPATAFEIPQSKSVCVSCGLCTLLCPTNAITEKKDTANVFKILNDEKKHVIIQTAPSIRVSIGEMFGMPPGSVVTKKMVSALRMLGFDRVFDTDFGADLTTVEETNEFIERLENNENLPLLTSCCPAWVKFAEHFYPDFLPNISTCKSPHEMLGAVIKTYYAEKSGVKRKDMVVVSAMPCTAKKFEITRPELNVKGYRAVDFVLTTRELAWMIKKKGIDFLSAEEQDFDAPLGISSGAGLLFGATGGVAESVLRVTYKMLTKKKIKKINFSEVRGLHGIKEGEITINNKKIKIAIVHGLGNAKTLLERMRRKKAEYHIVEIMACPGGCIGGGGQPKTTTMEIIKKRAEAIYMQDKKMKIRLSDENPAVIKVYKEFLKKPLSKTAEALLHTKYIKRNAC